MNDMADVIKQINKMKNDITAGLVIVGMIRKMSKRDSDDIIDEAETEMRKRDSNINPELLRILVEKPISSTPQKRSHMTISNEDKIQAGKLLMRLPGSAENFTVEVLSEVTGKRMMDVESDAEDLARIAYGGDVTKALTTMVEMAKLKVQVHMVLREAIQETIEKGLSE